MGALALIGLLTGSAAAAGQLATTPSEADATSMTNIGLTNGYGGFMGTQLEDGNLVFCADPSLEAPLSRTPDSVDLVGEIGPVQGSAGTYGDNVGRVNMAVTKFVNGEYGDVNDPTLAAAVAGVVYNYNSASQNGAAYMTASASAGLGAYNSIMADIENNFVLAGGGGTGSGSLTFNVDPLNNYSGTVSVIMSPSDATGTLTLTNGIFTTTGTNTAAVSNGSSLSIVGVPPADNATDYKISGHVDATGPAGYSNTLTVYSYGDAYQRVVGPGQPGTGSFSFDGEDPTTRSTVFAPTVGTKVASKFVEVGEYPVDTITFSTTAVDGVNNPWRQRTNGTYLELVAHDKLYGPFQAPVAVSDEVPAGAPVAGHATVTTTAADGPTITYEAKSDQPVLEAGYYVWRASIDAADQTVAVRAQLPAGYTHADQFGLVAETHVSPSTIQFTTQLDKSQAALNGTVTDSITAAVTGGPWLQANGSRIPVNVTQTAYWTPEQPVLGAEPTADAVAIGTSTVTVTGPVIPTLSEPIPVGTKKGWVSIQSCIVSDNQGEFAGYVKDWCDQFGVPSETVQVLGPTISTKAQPISSPGGTVTDTAIVDGPLPVGGIDITFVGYLQPGDTTTPVCGVDNTVYTSSNPIHVTEPGEYTSEEFAVTDEHTGTVYWVETGYFPGTDTIIHEGKCGLPNETTTITPPTVVTKAVDSITVGQAAHDTALVDGWILTGSTLEFHLYKQNGAQPECATTNEIPVPANSPIGVTPDLNIGTEYVSADVTITTAGTYFWVETLKDASGKVIHQGKCGAPGETTIVTEVPPTPPAPPVTPVALALTGANGEQAFLLGGIALLVAIAGATALIVPQRRRARSSTTTKG